MSARARGPQGRLGARLLGAACLVAAALTAHGFFASAEEYSDYHIPQAGMINVHPQELAVQAVYVAHALPFAALLALGLSLTGLAAPMAAAARSLARRRALAWLLPVALAAVALGVRLLVLGGEVITDDEEVYRFVARTLLSGRLVNPSPGDAEFFTWQFLVHTADGWYGKYPIGHPLLLAAALAAGLESALPPLLAAATAWLTYRLGARLLGHRRALLGVVLLALSPHFVLTHATLLSQTTSAACLMLGLNGLWEGRWGSRAWAWCGGAALGFAVLARPMPGALWAVGATLISLLPGPRERWSPLPALKRAAPFVAPALAFGLVLLAVNALQAGSPLASGYERAHGGTGVAVNHPAAVRSLSLFMALWRENLWLFGWPLSLAAVALARVPRGRWLLWMPFAAALLYRLVVPKTVVSTTGPIYMLEAVPTLALLGADGVARASAALRRRGGWWRASLGASAVVALCITGVALYAPIQLGALATAAEARRPVFRMLDEAGAQTALVFTENIASLHKYPTWAYFPPTPSPALDDARIFVRWPRERDAMERAVGFWRRRYPERRAFRFIAGERPQLVELGRNGL